MGIRDDEIKRLKKYAEGLGIKIEFKDSIRGLGSAEWCMVNQTIVIYGRDKMCKTDVILSILHELGHHMDWIYNNKKLSQKAYRAYELLNSGNMYGSRLDIPKKYRKVILEEELAGIYYMDIIYKELNLRIPYWKVKMQQDLDAYDYRMLYTEGRFSTIEELAIYRVNIIEYYKEKYGRKE